MANNVSWKKIFDDYKISNHNFSETPFYISSQQIKTACQNFTKTGEKEVRILCKQDRKEDRPDVFKKNNLFILPVRNGLYAIVQGQGYIDIPEIKEEPIDYNSKLPFTLETSLIGNSEMQHIDFAYASSLIRTFMTDESLVLTIRGRKYTPEFTFRVGQQIIKTQSVQTEIDAGYEGKDQIVLVEAKNSTSTNTIIRQLYYPFRQWSEHTKKKIHTLFFEKRYTEYLIWQFEFTDKDDYNSIKLIKSERFKINLL